MAPRYGQDRRMIRPIMRSEVFLAIPSDPTTREDAAVAQDLLDTLAAHAHECVGMAANMIGVAKRIIVFDDAGLHRIMYNLRITAKSQPFDAEEGCLSLPGRRAVKRFGRIRVDYLDAGFESRSEWFSGWTAQIIQHEIDHCDGIVI